MITYETVEIMLEMREEVEQALLHDHMNELEEERARDTIAYVDKRLRKLLLKRISENLERWHRGLPEEQINA